MCESFVLIILSCYSGLLWRLLWLMIFGCGNYLVIIMLTCLKIHISLVNVIQKESANIRFFSDRIVLLAHFFDAYFLDSSIINY